MKNIVQIQSQSIVRPSDTTAYADGDVIAAGTAAALQFKPQLLRNSDLIILQHAMLFSSANVSTKLIADLWLFSAEPAAIDADNAAWTPTDADLDNLISIVNFPSANWRSGDATSGAGGNAVCPVSALAIPIPRDRTANEIIFAVPVARNAYVPVSAEEFTFRLAFIGT